MEGMASATSSAFVPRLGSGFSRSSTSKPLAYVCEKIQRPNLQLSTSIDRLVVASSEDGESFASFGRRSLLGCPVLSSLILRRSDAIGAGLPPEEKPKLCNDECEKELENVPLVTTESGLQYKEIIVGQGPSPPVGYQVVANYVAMVPSGQIFDSSLEKGLPYTFRVGADQVIKGLDEGVLSMKVGGRRRLYIPGSLAFPKGLSSAPGRPRVGANSPVVFDVSLEYIPGLEFDEDQ